MPARSWHNTRHPEIYVDYIGCVTTAAGVLDLLFSPSVSVLDVGNACLHGSNQTQFAER